MTFKLVCTNITVVMEEDRKKLTEKKLLSCGKREFLEKGYAKANLRSICEASGVTTGAFYFSFASKEALLRAMARLLGCQRLGAAMANAAQEGVQCALLQGRIREQDGQFCLNNPKEEP